MIRKVADNGDRPASGRQLGVAPPLSTSSTTVAATTGTAEPEAPAAGTMQGVTGGRLYTQDDTFHLQDQHKHQVTKQEAVPAQQIQW